MRSAVAVGACIAGALMLAGAGLWVYRSAAAFDEDFLKRLTSLNEKIQRRAFAEARDMSEARLRHCQQVAATMLHSPDVNRRLCGVCALGILGSRPYLHRVQLERRLLSDPEPAVRFAVAILPALPTNSFSLRRSVSVLCDALQDRSRLVRWAAARSLGDLALGDVFPLAMWRLDPHDPDRAALLELMAQSSLQTSDVNSWVGVLHSPIVSDRRIALHALAVIGLEQACDDVVACLHDADASIRATACIAVAQLRCTKAVPKLFQLAQDPNVRVRGNAKRALGMLQAEGAIALCEQTLQQPPEPAPVPVRHRDPPEVAFQDASGRAIRLPCNASSSMFKPRTVLDWEGSEERDERFCALVGLILSQDSSAETILLSAARDRDPRVREGAALGLTSFGNPQTMEQLVIDSKRPLRARIAAARWLGENDRLQHLPVIAAAASESLNSTDESADAIEFLRQLLRELGRSEQTELLPVLRRAARHPSPDARKAALHALASLSTDEARAVVRDVERHDYDRNVVAAATQELSRIDARRRVRSFPAKAQ